jgi:hypothetical protein
VSYWWIRRAIEHGRCHEEVSRKGHCEPCDKTAVAVRQDPDGYPAAPYPVCAYHARGQMVTLAEIREAFNL